MNVLKQKAFKMFSSSSTKRWSHTIRLAANQLQMATVISCQRQRRLSLWCQKNTLTDGNTPSTVVRNEAYSHRRCHFAWNGRLEMCHCAKMNVAQPWIWPITRTRDQNEGRHQSFFQHSRCETSWKYVVKQHMSLTVHCEKWLWTGCAFISYLHFHRNWLSLSEIFAALVKHVYQPTNTFTRLFCQPVFFFSDLMTKIPYSSFHLTDKQQYLTSWSYFLISINPFWGIYCGYIRV